jgi:acetylglutamate kinase
MLIMKKQILVVKCGGSILAQTNELTSMLHDLYQLRQLDYQIILVHGGGPDINQLAKSLDIQSEFKHGLRVTTPEVLAITQLALLGKTNAGLTLQLNQAKLNAIGLSGHDANLLIGNCLDPVNLGLVGEVTQVNCQLIQSLLELDLIPVIAPLAISSAGEVLNINADLAAAAIAEQMHAQKLILLSDIDGYYANYPDKASLLPVLELKQIQQLLAQENLVAAGMRPKLQACVKALSLGTVASAQIINGQNLGGLLATIQNPTSLGTLIIPGDCQC